MSAVRKEAAAADRRSTKCSRSPLLAGFDVHRVGVTIDAGIDQRTWYEFGKLLQVVDYARDWIIADWLVFGEHQYGDKIYESAARLLGKSPRTWEDYAYIARNVRISERSEILPALVHRPVARFSDDPRLQRELIELAEENSLSKATFELVIELYLAKKPYKHLLGKTTTPIDRARYRAEKERKRVLRRARRHDGKLWLAYAREQAEAWRLVLKELEGTKLANSGARKKPRGMRSKGHPRVRRDSANVSSSPH